MALIQCPECQNQVSDKAPACPKCGAPIGSQPASPVEAAPKRRTSLTTWGLSILVVVGAIMFFQSSFRQQNLPQMPIEVKYRPALLGPGLVVAINNTSDRHLSILATFKNPSVNQEKSFRVDVPPRGKTELGHREGWTFASGDQIELSHNDYKPWQGNIP